MKTLLRRQEVRQQLTRDSLRYEELGYMKVRLSGVSKGNPKRLLCNWLYARCLFSSPRASRNVNRRCCSTTHVVFNLSNLHKVRPRLTSRYDPHVLVITSISTDRLDCRNVPLRKCSSCFDAMRDRSGDSNYFGPDARHTGVRGLPWCRTEDKRLYRSLVHNDIAVD